MTALVRNTCSTLLSGCCHEAERARLVGNSLEGLRNVLPDKLHAHLNILELFASFGRLIFLQELSQVGCYLELMRVGVGILALSKLLYFAAADLVVLLENDVSQIRK